jgi:hypothetical protein
MFLTAIELRDRALAEVGYQRGGLSSSIPLPSGRERMNVAVFFYLIGGRPSAREVYPPHLLLILDPTSGAVLRRRDVLPKDVGPDAPPGEPLPRHPDERRVADGALFIEHERRLHEILAQAFWAFHLGKVRFSSDERALVVECAELFDEVVQKRLLPWYEAIGGPFLAWLREVRAGAKAR